MANKTGKIEARLELVLDALNTQIKTAQAQLSAFASHVERQSGDAAKKTQAAYTTAFAAIALISYKAAKAVIASFKDTIKVFANFEQSLANTQSVARATEEDFLKLEEAARRIGATTRSTASEAANALYYLASAGFTAAEAIAALDGVNALAIATGSDLAKTSETIAVVIRQFGLETSQATNIANVFTSAITGSLATLDKLTNAFEYVGPIAAGLGRTVEETTGTLQVLFNKGFSGEKAGRALRRVFVDLADSTSIVNRRLAKLGISFDDVNPTVNSMADIVDVLNASYVDATNVAAIFGKISGAQMASLLAAGGDAIREMEASVTGTNQAFEAMAIQMDTLQGSFDKFKNANEALKITLGKELSPALRTATDIATSFLLAINDMPPKLLAIVSGVAGIAVASTALGFALIKTAGILGLTFLPGLGPLIAGIAGVTTAIGLLVAGTAALSNLGIKKATESFSDMTNEMQLTGEEAKTMIRSFSDVSFTLNNFGKNVLQGAFGTPQRRSVSDLSALMHRLADEYDISIEKVIELAERSTDLTANYGAEIEAIKLAAAEQRARDEIAGESSKKRYDAQQEYIDALKQEKLLKEFLAKLDDDRKRAVDEQASILKTAFSRSVELAKLLGDEYDRNADLSDVYTSAIKALVESGLTAESDGVQSIINLYKELQAEYGNVINKNSDYAKRLKIQNELRATLAVISEKELAAARNLIEYDAAAERASATQKALNDLFDAGFTLKGSGITAFLEEFGKYLQGLEEAIDSTKIFEDEFLEAEQAWFKGREAVREYTEKLELLNATAIKVAESERDKALAAVKGNKAAEDAINDYFDAYIKGLKDVAKAEKLAEFFSKLETGVNVAMDLLSAIDDFHSATIDRMIADEERYYDALQKLREDDLVKLFEDIDAREQAELAAKGLLEETERERLEREIAEAIIAGDTVTAAELQKEIDRLDIKEKYDAERLQAQEDYDKEQLRLEDEKARKIADLEYKAALQTWQLAVLSATANVAVALAKAISTLNPFVIATTSIAGAAAIGSAIAAKPSAPAFKDGGIIPGSSTKGDQNLFYGDAGELIMNKAQQQNIAEQLTGKGQSIVVHSYLIVDGEQMAKNSAKYYNNGKVVVNL